MKFTCGTCSYIYDPEKGDSRTEKGIAVGTAFDDLPDDWDCPICGTTKDGFSPTDEKNLCNRWN